MPRAFNRFAQVLVLAIVVLGSVPVTAQAYPPMGYYSSGYYYGSGYSPYTSGWYTSASYPYYSPYYGGYSSMGYSPYYNGYSTPNYLFNSFGYSPTYYNYGLGMPINGSYGSAYYPNNRSSTVVPASTSFYQDSTSPITPAFYSENGLRSDKPLPDRTVHLRITVPDPNADVVIDGTKTNTIGVVREYRSPSLADGTYTYEIRASWIENGRSKTKTEKIKVTPGSWSAVKFPESSTAQ